MFRLQKTTFKSLCIASLIALFFVSSSSCSSICWAQEATEEKAEEATEDSHSGDSHSEGDHGGEQHREVGAGAASEGLYSVVDFRTDKALFTLATFGLLIAALYAFAWKPVVKGLETREETIANNISDAESANAKAAAKLAEYEAKLAEAAAMSAQLVADAKKDAEAAGQRIIAEAQIMAERQKERAVAEIETAKIAALSELSTKSTNMAFGMARNIVGRELNQSDHKSLIEQAVASLEKKN
jgi:F-type H+-transporting ATPase subunit b